MIWLRLFGSVLLVALGWSLLAPTLPELRAALAQAGWQAVPVLAVVHVVPVVLCGLAWAALVPGRHTGLFLLCRWVRDGFNEILAIVPLAGEAAGLRLLTRRGVKAGLAGASMVADLTAEAVAQVLFTLGGLALWGRAQAPDLLLPGALVASVAVGGFIAVQRGGGIRLLEGVLPKRWQPSESVHATLMQMHDRPGPLIWAMVLHVAAWVSACAEAWVALRLLGSPISLEKAVMLESAVFALRSAAFFVPGALGLQEGGYALLGPLLGLSPATAVTVSLLKRGRELLLGVPAVLVWAWLIRRRLPGEPGA